MVVSVTRHLNETFISPFGAPAVLNDPVVVVLVVVWVFIFIIRWGKGTVSNYQYTVIQSSAAAVWLVVNS